MQVEQKNINLTPGMAVIVESKPAHVALLSILP
jgi:hypothetical protein